MWDTSKADGCLLFNLNLLGANLFNASYTTSGGILP